MYNHLLQKREVGAPIYTREKPPSDMCFGVPPQERRFEDTSQAALLWDTPDSPSAKTKRKNPNNTFITANIKKLSNGSKRVARVSSTTGIDTRLPHELNADHRYGIQGRPSTPMNDVISHAYAHHSDDGPVWREETKAPKKISLGSAKIKSAKIRAASGKENAESEKELFKLRKFTRAAKSRLDEFHRK